MSRPDDGRPDDDIMIEIVRGVEGNAVYLEGYRVAGPKPWGGGPVINRWSVPIADIEHALRMSRARHADRAARVIGASIPDVERIMRAIVSTE